ncbi:MAG: CoA transferase, partial [Brucellaceae bacterium]|nr:CoA transferase [Brucellaceae bacterium]
MLAGVRVVEFADETAEYCGLLLAGLGADVIKVEPPDGSPTRGIGPFWKDEPGPDRSLYFWAYNREKRSFSADLDVPQGRDALRSLV